MIRIPLLTFVIFLTAFSADAQTSGTISLRQNGWVIDCSQEKSSLSISTDRLGSIAREIQLNEETPSGLRRLTHLSASTGANGQLIIKTREPISEWEITAQPDEVTIATTDFHGVMTGWADSPDGRSVVRLIDKEGLPVNWRGTGEVTETYGGDSTSLWSNLPRHNPEITYLGLGHVAGGGLHSLFDRATDIAIDFGEGSELQAVAGNNDAFTLKIPVRDNATIRLTPDYYTHTLGIPFYVRYDDSHFHSWVTNWDAVKFPHGPEWLTSYIRDKGLKAGIWVVPNAYGPALKEHPDWYLYDKQGKVLLDYQTPALDSTNPAVFDHLKRLFTRLDELGFDYYKFDGELALPAYAPEIDKSRMHSPAADFIANYRDRLALIRHTIGPDRFIELCPTGTKLNAVGYADSYFLGQDLYNNWQGMYSFFSSINAHLFLNHIVSYVMPGEGLELGEPISVEQAKQKRYAVTLAKERQREDPMTGFGTTLPEARTLVTYVALTGVTYSLASVMPELPEERVKLLQATMPTLPIMPIDLFSRGTDSTWNKFKFVQADYYIHHYAEVLDLKVDSAAGVYDVAAETNWRSEATERSLEFARQLGLSDEGRN